MLCDNARLSALKPTPGFILVFPGNILVLPWIDDDWGNLDLDCDEAIHEFKLKRQRKAKAAEDRVWPVCEIPPSYKNLEGQQTELPHRTRFLLR